MIKVQRSTWRVRIRNYTVALPSVKRSVPLVVERQSATIYLHGRVLAKRTGFTNETAARRWLMDLEAVLRSYAAVQRHKRKKR